MRSQSFTISETSRRDFNNALKRYLRVSSRSLPEALNEKAYFVAAGAIRNTHKADFEKIKSELGAHMVGVIGKRGKELKRKKLALVENYYSQLIVLIIVARLRRAGKPIPPADELKDMALGEVRKRIASVGYIRSGWVAAVRVLARFSKYGRLKFEMPKMFGSPRGGVKIAREGDPVARIWNDAGRTGKQAEAVAKYGQEGLERAFKEETADMLQHLEGKLKDAAVESGIKTN